MSKTQTQTQTKTQAKTGNPFLNGDFGAMMDFTKIAGQFKVPGFDASALIESQRRNIEAFTEINRVAFDGARAIAQRQAEILRQVTDEATKAVRELTKPGKPEDALVKQADLAKQTYEQCLANLRELTEIGTKSNTQAVELFNHRVTDGLNELKGAFKHTNGAK